MHNPNSYILVVEISLMKDGPNTQIILENFFLKFNQYPMMWLDVYQSYFSQCKAMCQALSTRLLWSNAIFTVSAFMIPGYMRVNRLSCVHGSLQWGGAY